MRDKLRERRKKQSKQQRRAHAGAMQALATLQSAQDQPDADTLHAALEAAAGHTRELPALEEEMSAAQGRLASLSLAALPTADSDAAAPRVVELSADQLSAATDGFAETRVVGTGGFAQVYVADAMPSLPRVAADGGRLAVKRANAGLDLQDLRAEVTILQAGEHARLMPLYGYCVDTIAPCLVFPLMVGGAPTSPLSGSPTTPL
jgi:interleukin-1 receptor-associated kinase 1